MTLGERGEIRAAADRCGHQVEPDPAELAQRVAQQLRLAQSEQPHPPKRGTAASSRIRTYGLIYSRPFAVRITGRIEADGGVSVSG
jgi:hypothetical protein